MRCALVNARFTCYYSDYSVWMEEKEAGLMKTKAGFTWIVLKMVILVMAILATVLIIVVLCQGRCHGKCPGIPRIQATCESLQMGLTNYRAAEQRWPLTLVPQADSNHLEFREDNARVFAPLFENPKKMYVDPSALLTKVPAKGVMPLREAMKQKIPLESCPLGYLDPANKEVFKYFKVTFNLSLDTVYVGK